MADLTAGGSGVGYESQGLMFGGSALIDDSAISEPPPDTHRDIQLAWLDITAGPDLDDNGQPDASSWTYTEHHGVWGHYRIWISGKSVTYFRGVQTLILEESGTEPFGDESFVLQFPAIGPFEALGVGDLWWLPGTDDDQHVPIRVVRVKPDTTTVDRWEGDIAVNQDTYDGITGQLLVRCEGLAYTLDQRITKPRNKSTPIDCGKFIHDLVAYEVKYGWNGHGVPQVATGVQTAERGGYGDPLATVTLQNILAQLQHGDDRYTISNRRPRGLRLVVKDRETVHFTLWCGQRGVTHNLTRDLTHGVDAIYGEGMDHGTLFWRNMQYPNVEDTPPDYPLGTGVFFNPGDGHTGFKPFSDELRSRGYSLASRDSYLAGDEDTIKDFQDDVGITVDGVVGGQTWNAAFQTGISAQSLYAYIRPLAVVTQAEPFRYNGRGGIIGNNPSYTGRTRREKKEDFGTLSKALAKKSAKAELPIIKHADWAGDVILTNIDPPEMPALDIQHGMNFLFKGHRNTDRLLHIARAHKVPGMVVGTDRVVTLTSSERGDDYVTLAARIQQRRDVVDMSGRTRAPRRQANVTPDFAPWDEESGAGRLKPKAQTAGLWNVYDIPSGERGSIEHVRLVADVDCLVAAAVFNWQVTAAQLVALPGLDDPSAGGLDGADPWQGNATKLTRRPLYADQPWLAWATGGPGAMQGYWPNTPAPDATVTGVLDDSQSWPFHSRNGVFLFLAVWTSESCNISGDPDWGYRALFPGANT
jgi:hypothetical protein